MITSLSIRNVRGIRELSLQNLGQINVFVGRNNVGKSSILEAIAIALGAVNRDPSQLKEVLDRVLKWRGWLKSVSLTTLFNVSSLPIEITFIANNVPFNVALNYPRDVAKLFGREFNLDLDRETLRNMVSESIELIHFQVQSGPIKHTAFVLVSEGGEIKVMSSMDEPYPVELPVRFVTPYDLNTPGFIEVAFSNAFKAKAYYDALELIQMAYPEVEGISPVHEKNSVVMYVDIKHATKSVPYYSMGDGFKFLSEIAFLVASMKNGYLLIDSAEAFHHPKSLGVMVKTLVKGAKTNNVQVFLTTHSLELLDMLLEYGISDDVDGRVIHMKRENDNITAKVETFERANELRETIGLDLRG